MPIKNQTKCYRNIDGRKYVNYSDLIQGAEEVEKIIAEAKAQYTFVRQIAHPDGYNQLFVSKPKLYKAQLVDIGRSKSNRDVYYNTRSELHKEIQKHLVSKGWDMSETETAGTYEISTGRSIVGTVIVTEVKVLD